MVLLPVITLNPRVSNSLTCEYVLDIQRIEMIEMSIFFIVIVVALYYLYIQEIVKQLLLTP